VRDLIQRAELGCGVPAPPIIRLARLVAGEAAPKERVRVFSARFKIPLRVFRLCVILERSEESRIFLFPSPEGEASGARGEVARDSRFCSAFVVFVSFRAKRRIPALSLPLA
jgi:hypothetical protein